MLDNSTLFHSPWFFIAFNVFVLAMLALDLGVFQRKAHVIAMREALFWSILWTVLGLLFAVFIYFITDVETAMAYTTGYLIERALSMDNIFVFVLIFSYFGVKPIYQHRVLFWGIIGALVMRGAMIAIGAALISSFHAVIFIFGAFLVYTGIKMARSTGIEVEPDRNPVVRLARRFLPVTPRFEGHKFLVRRDGKLMATPLLLVLLVVESTDVVFAVDSIPAIFAITQDPIVVYTSNIFAILGLRALYFLLAGMMERFRYLKPGLSLILVFVGVKMLLTDLYHIPMGVSLGVIILILVVATVASLLAPQEEEEEASHGDDTDGRGGRRIGFTTPEDEESASQ